jgi:RoxA-like, cytochrome c-like/Cytochrome C oxidase, cbb3-type, subunit III
MKPNSKSRRCGFRGFRWLVFGVVLVAGVYLVIRFNRDRPVDYADAEEHFKYGSTGGERTAGIPVALWNILPDIFQKYLPGRGFQSLGFIYETNRAFPIGVSERNVQGVNRVFLNCAVCHVGTVRDTPGSPRRIIVGMPANNMDLQAFERFLFACSRDEDFNGSRLVDEIAKRKGDDWLNRLLLRYYGVGVARQQLITLAQRFSFMDREPDTGPGRVDTFNPPKVLLNFRMDDLPTNEWVGNCDLPSIWNQSKREGMWLHWDGNNNSVDERNRSAAYGTGATPPTLDRASLQRMRDFIWTNTPPPWPYGIDIAKAERGEKIYASYCARCHGKSGSDFTGQLVGQVTPIEEIRTDRHRLDSYTEDLCVNQGLLYAAYPAERFSHFRKTFGYANQPLDGIWLRGPYLHNGSVPTLRELLEPAAKRRAVFYRGYDVIDRTRVGFISDVPEENGRKYFKYDTRLPGNGNFGHEGEEYGTYLANDDKDAVVEYLKTF